MPAEIIFHHDIGFDGNRWLASPPSSPLRQQKPPLQHQHQHSPRHSPRYQDSPRHSLPGTSRSNSHRRNSNNSNSNSNNNDSSNNNNNNDNVDRHVRLAVDDILREHHDAIPFPNLQRQCRVFHRDSFSTISTRESEDPDARHRMTCTYAPLSSYNNNDGNNNNNNNEEEVKTTRSHEHDRLPIAISFPSDFGAEDDNFNNNSNNNAKDTNGCPLEDVDVDVLDGYGSNDADDIVFVPGEEDVVSRSSSIEVVRDISKRVAAHKISETPLQQQQQQQQRSSWPQQQQQRQRQRQRRSWQPPQQHHHHQQQQQQQQQKQRQAPQPPGSPARSNANSRKQRERWNTTDLVAVVDPAWSPPTALIPTTKATTATTTATTTTTASMASSLSPFRGRRLRKASLGSAAADPLPMRRDRDRSHTCEHEFEHEFAVRPLARDGSMVRVGSVATNESPPRPFKRFEI